MTSDISTIGTEGGEKVCRTPMGLDIVVTREAPARLPGAGPLSQAHRLVAHGGGAYLFVGIRGGGTDASVTRRPQEVLLGPGDICFYAADRPPVLRLPRNARLKVFLVRREALGLEEHDVHRLTAAPVGRSSRLGGLLSPFLSELADTVSSSQPSVGGMLARNAVNLLATLATDQLGRDRPGTGTAGTPGARSPLLSRVLEYVDAHLADADLCPEVIAGAHHISVRYLHKLFQEEGTTVGRWIQRRRLEECRRDLVQGVRGRQTIAAVAGRWGFLSATHFSRVFRAAYGMSPSEWRDTSGGSARVRLR
ncbi:helix-turn-helix domain-containing protein [Streptomyces phyllanthi]|uniref:Helix-turn-helix domain-containing protein n=1 Tax=Streptomyces phyllanthi TaxID=1803180 RepID=A0A5N8W2Q8_9ACTN|nr:helix-turn-helix domain-containing protein [Streptomyces phyllanthi]MPY41783.1 helix-turn-helix domain-containing protein [Streptomyces phyllanthi]